MEGQSLLRYGEQIWTEAQIKSVAFTLPFNDECKDRKVDELGLCWINDLIPVSCH